MFSNKRTYLDWAAAAPVSPAAQRAYSRTLADSGNPSSPHAEGRAAKAQLEEARTRIARLLAAKADDIVFTSGATEANNIAIIGHAYALMGKGIVPEGMHALYLSSAHASVIEPMRVLRRLGVETEPLPIADGAVDIGKMKAMLRPETMLVSMDFVCGETGTVWDTREVRHALPASVVLHADAAQAPLEEGCERTRVGADLLVLDAQKIGGVRGMGALIAPRHIALSAVMFGGGQERGLRSGTPWPAHAAAFAAALESAKEGAEAFRARAQAMRGELVRSVSGIKGIHINEGKEQVAHILNLSLPGHDTDYLVALLDEAGFAVSTKSACETDSTQGSRAVMALTGDAARAKSTLRVSWGPSTSERDLSRFSAALVRAVAFLDGKRA